MQALHTIQQPIARKVSSGQSNSSGSLHRSGLSDMPWDELSKDAPISVELPEERWRQHGQALPDAPTEQASQAA